MNLSLVFGSQRKIEYIIIFVHYRFYKLSRKDDASFFGAFCDCVVSAFQTLFSLIAGSFVTAGAYRW